MAKRKKSRKGARRTSRRRRSIGAMNLNPTSPIVQIGAAALGFVFGDKINAGLDHVTGTLDPKIVGAGQIGLGAALVFMKLGKKKTIVEVLGGGVLAGAGIKRELKAFGIINGIGGYGAVPVLNGRKQIAGYNKVPVLNGGFMTPSLNGVFNGYNVPAVPSGQRSNVVGCADGGLTYENSGSCLMG
jgi:hypothetical protein